MNTASSYILSYVYVVSKYSLRLLHYIDIGISE